MFSFVSNPPLTEQLFIVQVSLTFGRISQPKLNWNSCFRQTLTRAAEQSVKQKCKCGVCKRIKRVEDLLCVPRFSSHLFASFALPLPAWIYWPLKDVGVRILKNALFFLPSITVDPSYGLYYSLSTALIHWTLPSISTGWWINPHPLILSLIWSPRCMR